MRNGLKSLVILASFLILIFTASATDLQNIETVTPYGTQDIEIQGNVNMTGNLELRGNNLIDPNQVDGVDIENPGNAITINGDQYAVASSSIYQDELNTGNVDNRYVNLGGDTMTGNLNLGNNQLTNVGGTDCNSNEALLGDGSCGTTGGGSLSLAETLDNGRFTDGTDILVNNSKIEFGSDTNIEIGRNTAANNESLAIGKGARANGSYSYPGYGNETAVGTKARATGRNSSAFGVSAKASDRGATATGVNSEATAYHTTAIGENAEASGRSAVATGYNAKASALQSTATGENSEVAANGATATGARSSATDSDATATGFFSNASGRSATATGYDAKASADLATATGSYSDATEKGAAAIGNEALASGFDAIATGKGSEATARGSIALGGDIGAGGFRGAEATKEASVAIGPDAVAPNAYEATFGNLQGQELDVNVTGNLTVHGNGGVNVTYGRVTSLADPSNAQDAATKSYVDNNDDTGSDSQDLSNNLDNSPGVGYVDHDIQITGGSNTVARDYYEADTDNQNLAEVLSNGNSAGSNDIDMNGNDIFRMSSQGRIEVGNADGGDGVSGSNFVGMYTYWDTDEAAFGLRDYGSERKDAVINIEQQSDNIRFQVQGTDRMRVNGGGEVDILDNQLDMNGNDVVNMGQYSIKNRDLLGNGGGRAMVTFQNGGNPTIMTINYNGDYNKVVLGSEIDMNSSKVINLADPSSAQDAATKSYVDSNTGSSDDEQVAVDSSASPGYLGNDSSGGVLRTGSSISYGDNGDYVTLGTDWSDANDLNSNGGISDFSNGNDLNSNGDVVADQIDLNDIESVSGGQIGRDDSIGYLGSWGGNGNAVLWDAHNVQQGNAISITGGTGNDDNPQIAVDESQIADTDASNELQNLSEVLSQGNTADRPIRFAEDTNVEIGRNTAANNESLAIGKGALANGSEFGGFGNETAVGTGAQATTSQASAFGANSQASGQQATAIGQGAKATGYDGPTAIGYNAEAIGDDGDTAIGYNAKTTDHDATAIGIEANASGSHAVATGHRAEASGNGGSIATGFDAEASDVDSIAIGNAADATAPETIAIGAPTDATASEAIAIGVDADADARDAAAVGSGADAGGKGSVALGGSIVGSITGASASQEASIAIGPEAVAPNAYETTFGNLEGQELDVNVTGNLTVHGDDFIQPGPNTNIEIGRNTNTNTESLAIGNGALANGSDYGVGNFGNETVVGTNAQATGYKSSAFGASAKATDQHGTAVGQNAKVTEFDSTAIGQDTNVAGSDATAIGYNATAKAGGATATGENAEATDNEATATGRFAEASASEATATGYVADATAKFATATGSTSDAAAERTTATGALAEATMSGATATGTSAEAYATEAIAIGHRANASGRGSIALGGDLGEEFNNGYEGARASQNASIAIGPDATAFNPGSVAIGNGSEARHDDTVTLGDRDGTAYDLRVTGDIYTDGGDLAEFYQSPQDLEAAEIVKISEQEDNRAVRTDEKFEEKVFGVVSSDPGQIMNKEEEEEGHAIALEGKVPVKLKEEVSVDRGDRIVPSKVEGKATKCKTIDPEENKERDLREIMSHNQRCESSTVGRSLEKAENTDEVLVKLE